MSSVYRLSFYSFTFIAHQTNMCWFSENCLPHSQPAVFTLATELAAILALPCTQWACEDYLLSDWIKRNDLICLVWVRSSCEKVGWRGARWGWWENRTFHQISGMPVAAVPQRPTGIRVGELWHWWGGAQAHGRAINRSTVVEFLAERQMGNEEWFNLALYKKIH